MIFARVFHVYCYAWCVAWRCENHRFVLIFTVSAVRRPFHTKQTHHNCVVKMVGVLWEGCWHHSHFGSRCGCLPLLHRSHFGSRCGLPLDWGGICLNLPPSWGGYCLNLPQIGEVEWACPQVGEDFWGGPLPREGIKSLSFVLDTPALLLRARLSTLGRLTLEKDDPIRVEEAT